MATMRDKAWSPYLAGVVVGLLQIPAFLLADTALGVSSSFAAAAGYLAALWDPGVTEDTYFSKYMTSSKYAWQGALVGGIALGAFVSSRLSGTARRAISPVWRKAAGIEGPVQRMAMAFGGGFLLLFGARLAGGCTSGHGISGLGQLAVGSSLAVVAMFAGGIAVAMLAYRRI